MKTGKKGFTLIELMIVLAIIAITATLVISNLASSRKSGNETSSIKGIFACREAQGMFKKSGQGEARAGDADADGSSQEYCLGPSLANFLDGAGQPLVPMVNVQPYHGYNYGIDNSNSSADNDPEVAGFASNGPVALGIDGDRDFAGDTVTGICWGLTTAGGATANTPNTMVVAAWAVAGVANPGPGGSWTTVQE